MTAVPRNADYPDELTLTKAELKPIYEIPYRHEVALNKMQFIEYLKTRSNFTCLDDQQKTVVSQELPLYYERYFEGHEKQLTFAGLTRLYSIKR